MTTRLFTRLMAIVLTMGAALAPASPNNDKARENDPLIARLEGMGRLPTKLCSWGMSPRILKNPNLLKPICEITGCASVDGRGWTAADAANIVAAKPDLILFNWSPYRGKFLNYDWWTKAEVTGPVTHKDIEYYVWVLGQMQEFENGIGGIPVVVMFDFELSDIPGEWPAGGMDAVHQNVELGRKLNWMVRIAKHVFGGDVFFYNARQWVPGPGLQISPANNSQIPTNTVTDFAAVEWYHNPFSLWNREVLDLTAERTELPVVIVFAVGGQYDEWPFTPEGAPRRFSKNFADLHTEGEAWYMGNSVLSAWSKRSVEKFGPRHDFAVAYPDFLEHSDDRFVNVLEGGLGITREIE